MSETPVDPRGAFGEHEPSREPERTTAPDSESEGSSGSASLQPNYGGAPAEEATEEMSAASPPRSQLGSES
jgi:hypothetical protein